MGTLLRPPTLMPLSNATWGRAAALAGMCQLCRAAVAEHPRPHGSELIDVAGLDLELVEASRLQQEDRVAGEVASAEDSLLHPVEAVLPAGDGGVRGCAVFGDVDGAAGLEHPGDLVQGGFNV